MILPMEHLCGGVTELEANIWEEMEKFMRSLTKMNYKRNCGTVFMETNLLGGKGRHTIVECFSLDMGMSF